MRCCGSVGIFFVACVLCVVGAPDGNVSFSGFDWFESALLGYPHQACVATLENQQSIIYITDTRGSDFCVTLVKNLVTGPLERLHASCYSTTEMQPSAVTVLPSFFGSHQHLFGLFIGGYQGASSLLYFVQLDSLKGSPLTGYTRVHRWDGPNTPFSMTQLSHWDTTFYFFLADYTKYNVGLCSSPSQSVNSTSGEVLYTDQKIVINPAVGSGFHGDTDGSALQVRMGAVSGIAYLRNSSISLFNGVLYLSDADYKALRRCSPILWDGSSRNAMCRKIVLMRSQVFALVILSQLQSSAVTLVWSTGEGDLVRVVDTESGTQVTSVVSLPARANGIVQLGNGQLLLTLNTNGKNSLVLVSGLASTPIGPATASPTKVADLSPSLNGTVSLTFSSSLSVQSFSLSVANHSNTKSLRSSVTESASCSASFSLSAEPRQAQVEIHPVVPLPPASRTAVQYAASSAAVASFGGSAGDVQGLIVVAGALGECFSGELRGLNDGGSVAVVPVSVGSSELGGLWFLFIVIAGGLVVHGSATFFMAAVQRKSFELVAGRFRFPSLCIKLFFLGYQGLTLEACRAAFQGSTTTVTAVGLFALAASVIVPLMLYRRACVTSARYLSLTDVFAENPQWQRSFFLPVGCWDDDGPGEECRRFGALFSMFDGVSSLRVGWLPYTRSLVLAAASTVVSDCRARFVIIASVVVLSLACRVALRPYRVRLQLWGGGTVELCTLVLIVFAVVPNAESVIAPVSVASSFVAVFTSFATLGMSFFYYKKWKRKAVEHFDQQQKTQTAALLANPLLQTLSGGEDTVELDEKEEQEEEEEEEYDL